MNAHEKQITFQELRKTARELKAKANADPVHSAAALLEYAISQLDKCDTLVEQNEGLERQKAKLEAEVKHLQERSEQLSGQVQNHEDTVASLKGQIEHYKRVLSDLQTQLQVDRNLHV